MTNYLAIYGTLGPGKPNHHIVAGIHGTWTKGIVRGYLKQEGWGADQGFPGIDIDPDGPEVEVDLLKSQSLENHWQRLDDFEGLGYKRALVEVETSHGLVEAYIYALA